MDISIIIPYNLNRGYLEKAIRSAKNQDFKGSYEVIVKKGDCFLGENINNALRKAKGAWIKILAEDDLLPVTCLTDLFSGIDGADWLIADAKNFGLLKDGWQNNTHYHSYCNTLNELLYSNSIHGGTTMYKKSMLFEIGGYDESLWTGEEYDLHLMLVSKGYKLKYINKIVYFYRLHEDNKSINMSVQDKARRRLYINKTIKSRYYV